MVTFENLAYRACAFTGAGTLLAVLANAAFGARETLLLASLLGAAIGSSIGWFLLRPKFASSEDAVASGRHKAAP